MAVADKERRRKWNKAPAASVSKKLGKPQRKPAVSSLSSDLSAIAELVSKYGADEVRSIVTVLENERRNA